tara:strand:+ start:14335 stop:15666 length:1332 start_codon:yes stop_codon:yes gene_type:complete
MTLRLLLVRHGLSSFNKDFRIQGRNDLSILTDEGIKQAVKTGETLSELSIDVVYSSPLQRAAETTKHILRQHPNKLTPIYTNDLLEVDLGPWSGLTKDEVKNNFPNEYITWQKEPKDLVIQRENGTSYKPIQELMLQAQTFVKKLLEDYSPEKNKTVLIVGHNAILRCILLNLLGDPDQGLRRLQVDNASISIINLKSKKTNPYDLQIQCLNSTTHLIHTLPSQKDNKRLILVRHGETNWNLEGRFQGQIDIPLNQNGQKQALAAGNFLTKVSIDNAYTSPMARPKETAEIILQTHPGVKLESKEKLVEIAHGLWEGKLESEIKDSWPKLLEKWQNSPDTVQMPEGENIKEVWERSVECFESICKELSTNQTALVVAHDAVNKTILCHLLGLTPSDIWMMKQGNGGITVIDIPEGKSQPNIVVCLNITSHLGGILDRTAAGAL